jgi:hypothetical protein
MKTIWKLYIANLKCGVCSLALIILQKLWCVSSLDVQTARQKEARSSEYRVTESGERARSVTDRRKYHLLVSGSPHNAQTSTHWPLLSVQKLWRVFRMDVQRQLPEGGSEQRISRHGVR